MPEKVITSAGPLISRYGIERRATAPHGGDSHARDIDAGGAFIKKSDDTMRAIGRAFITRFLSRFTGAAASAIWHLFLLYGHDDWLAY